MNIEKHGHSFMSRWRKTTCSSLTSVEFVPLLVFFLASPYFSSRLHFDQDSTGVCGTGITIWPIAN